MAERETDKRYGRSDKPYNAMAFFGTEYMTAAGLAQKFAGESGRLATLPDVIDARLATPVGTASWEHYVTSQSAEYFGYSKQGVPLLAVAHGVGPLASPEQVSYAYSSPLKPEHHGRTGMEGRISQRNFQKLLAGDYGEVTVVEIQDIISRYEYPFLEVLTAAQAQEDPLVHARLGPRYAEYLSRHAQETKDWAQSKKAKDPTVLLDTQHILRNQDAMNSSYIASLKYGSKYDPPLAHLLAISQLENMHTRDGIELSTHIACHEQGDGIRSVGIRSSEKVSGIYPSISIDIQAIADHLSDVLRPVDDIRYVSPLPHLLTTSDKWFTDHAREGRGMDFHEPEYVVHDVSPVSGAIEFTTQGGWGMFFKYDPAEVQMIAPRDANAYRLVGDIRSDDQTHTATVVFYKAAIDTSHYIPRIPEMESDFDTLMKFAEIPNK